MMSEAKVKIGPDILLYREKAPFGVSGVSIEGALEYDDVADLVRCHECGKWFPSLSSHVYIEHGMKIRAYKIKHGLNQTSALINERIRRQLINHGNSQYIRQCAADGLSRIAAGNAARTGETRRGPRMELRNRNGTCKAQILETLGTLASRLGRTPQRREMALAGLHGQSIEFVFGTKLRDVVSLAGLRPNARGSRRPTRYSQETLAEMLRDFWVAHHRVPSGSDYRRGLLPSKATFKRCFGSMGNAWFVAGLESEVARHRKGLGFQPQYTPEDLKALLRGFIAAHGRRPMIREFGSLELPPSEKTFRRTLGGSLPVVFSELEHESPSVAA